MRYLSLVPGLFLSSPFFTGMALADTPVLTVLT